MPPRHSLSLIALFSQVAGLAGFSAARRKPPTPPNQPPPNGYWTVSDEAPAEPEASPYNDALDALTMEMGTRTVTAVLMAAGMRLRRNSTRHLVARLLPLFADFIGRDAPTDPKAASLEVLRLTGEVGKILAAEKARVDAEAVQWAAEAMRKATTQGRADRAGRVRSVHGAPGEPCGSCGKVHEAVRTAGPLVALPAESVGPNVGGLGEYKHLFAFRGQPETRVDGMTIVVTYPTAGLDASKAVVLRAPEGECFLRGEVALDPVETDASPVVLPYLIPLHAYVGMTATVRPVSGADIFRWTARGELEHVIPLETTPTEVVPVQPHHTN